MGLNDTGWEKVLAAHRAALARDGYFTISSRELGKISGREPRLMAKHDFSTAVPAPLRQAGLNVIPVSRSHYLVGKFSLFHPFPDISGPVKTLRIPPGIETMGRITSEAVALNAGVVAGMLDDFLGHGPYYPTMSGRMSTLDIPLRLAGRDFTVERAQMEIDGGFESLHHLVIVEAKNHISRDFNIRQLYFPFRRFQLSLSKPVVPVYMVYTNGLVNLYRFEFTDPSNLHSIRLVDSARYALAPSLLQAQTLLEAVRAVSVVDTPVAFPQADNFGRVINLVELLEQRPLSKAEICAEYDFTPRQADYYCAAARYLGLVDDSLRLTLPGAQLVSAESRDSRNLVLIRALAARPVFHDVLAQAFASGQVPAPAVIANAISALGLSDSTCRRRAKTVHSWATWAMELAQPG
ncbi:type II restriction enzyme [Corynebacterium phocae]|nr:hypothetical protein [Corynebacterium phocae]KAA8726474.1 hypothetical protein F4V58_02920 [Corynebacterium phocae]